MNLKECRDEALKLIERYSVSGQTIALSYNGQSDYVLRMNGLINDALMTIATTVKKIDAEYKVAQSTDVEDDWVEYAMPDDFYERANAGAVYLNNKKLRGTDYIWKSSSKFLVKSELEGTISVMYARYPVKITAATNETTELDNSKDTHIAIPYYVAAMLTQQDNPYLSATLYNIYETKLTRISEGVQVEPAPIEDVYGIWG